MDSSFYIKSTYLTLEEVGSRSAVPQERLVAMIEAGCLPGAAYHLKETHEISSVFGDYTHSEERGYYPHSHIAKVVALSEKKQASCRTCTRRKRAVYRHL